MTPLPVLIHGTPCMLKTTGGDRLNPYVITRRDTGAVITQQPTRFLAVARAAQALLAEQSHAQPRPPALPGVPHPAHGSALAHPAHAALHPAAVPLPGVSLPAPPRRRRVLPEPGSADAPRAAGSWARGRPAGPGRGRGAVRAGEADEGMAV